MKTILYYCLTLLLCISVCNDAEAKKKKYPNGDVYEGEWKSGQPEGRGKMVYANGVIYEGEWKNGQREGVGKIILVNGTRFEGNWKKGLQEGKGKVIYANGDVYEGEWIKGKILEKGKMTYANGNVYEGEWKSGQPEGIGKMIYANGDVYEGKWWKGESHGKGKMIYANGDVYEGEWWIGTLFGSGKMTYANGDIYEGKWKKGKLDGNGKIIYTNGEKFECEWKDGKVLSKKVVLHPNINNISEFIGVKNGNRTMTGKVNYTNNNCFYDGELREYKRHGKGAYYFTPKNYITGIWKNDSLSSGSGEFFIAGNAAHVKKEANRPFTLTIKILENYKVILSKDMNINQEFTIDQLYDIASSEIAKIKENLPQELQRQAIKERERKERQEKREREIEEKWEQEKRKRKEKQEQEEKEQRRQELIKKYGVKFANAIVEYKIIVGMTKEMVSEVRSNWSSKHKDTRAEGIVERWDYYGYFGDVTNVIFVNGIVTRVLETEK